MGEKTVSIASSTPESSWKGWLWDSADVSKEERRFLLKVCVTTMLGPGWELIVYSWISHC